MITYVEGDLFTSPAQVLVNTVNTVGVMGKGIAKEFKAVYPDMFRIYQDLCERDELNVGKLFLYRAPHKWVLCFPTKRHWRQKSRIEDIETGLRSFVANYARHSLLSVAFPQLGCGNGELDWESQVRPLMERYLATLPIDIYIHVYLAGSLLPEHRDRRRMHDWLRTEPRSLPFGEVWNDLVALAEQAPDWYVVRDEEERSVALRTTAGGVQEHLPKADLFDVWQRFRDFGFLAAADVPSEHGHIAPALLTLLLSLAYVEEVCFSPLTSERASSATTNRLLTDIASRGLRLVPPIPEVSCALVPLPMVLH